MAENTIIVLINLSWQFILIFALSKLILTSFRIHSASIKNIVWLCVVLSPLILFPMNMIASDWVLINPSYQRPELTNTGINTNQNIDLFLKGMGHEGNLSGEISEDSSKAKSLSSQVSFKYILNKIPLLISIIWIAGVGRGIIILSVGLVKLKKLILKADIVMDNTIFSEIKEKLGLTREIHLLASSDIQIPFSTGFIRSYVIVPSDMSISDNRLRMILIHELAHLKRYDNFINIMCQITKAFMFFHPLYYLAMREFGLSSEQICDIYAIGITGTRDDYAQCLVDFSQAKMGVFSMGFGANRKSVSKRVKHILEGEKMPKITQKGSVFLLILSAIIITILSTLRVINPDSAEAQSPQKAQIAFSSNRDKNYEIYLMDTDGNNQRNITNNPAGDDYFPAWSPDGQKIAFVSTRNNGNQEIYVMDADGSNQIRLTDNPWKDQSPEWSPDGKTIAFTSDRDGNYQIYVMDADGSNQRNITNNPINAAEPSWSPDGEKIAFCGWMGDWDDLEIYVMDVDGNNITNLTNNDRYDEFPNWSPDGKTILFGSQRDFNWSVYIMDADGKNTRRLTNNPGEDTYLCWSPDGKAIAFTWWIGGKSEIYVMDTDGKNQINLTDNPADDRMPSWFDPSVQSVSFADKFMSTWGWLKRILD